MVRDDTVAVIKAIFDDFRKGDVASIVAQVTDDVDWNVPGEGSVIPFGGHVRGKAAVANFFQKVGETCDFTQFDTNEFYASGDRVVVLGEWTALVRATGKATTDEFAMAFRMRGDKIAAYRQYSDTTPLIAAFTPDAKR